MCKILQFCPIDCGQKEWYLNDLKDGEEIPDKKHPVSILRLFLFT